MKRIFLFVALAFALLTASAVDTAALKQRAVAKLEEVAVRMLPKQEFDEMLGFFGPVTKKYLPQARAALDEAKAMKVPPKYETKKAEYLAKVETFVSILNLSADPLRSCRRGRRQGEGN